MSKLLLVVLTFGAGFSLTKLGQTVLADVIARQYDPLLEPVIIAVLAFAALSVLLLVIAVAGGILRGNELKTSRPIGGLRAAPIKD